MVVGHVLSVTVLLEMGCFEYDGGLMTCCPAWRYPVLPCLRRGMVAAAGPARRGGRRASRSAGRRQQRRGSGAGGAAKPRAGAQQPPRELPGGARGCHAGARRHAQWPRRGQRQRQRPQGFRQRPGVAWRQRPCRPCGGHPLHAAARGPAQAQLHAVRTRPKCGGCLAPEVTILYTMMFKKIV